MIKKELIGCIADDFTGASDVCSFLIESGANCVILNDIHQKDIEPDIDVVVVALKIRTAPIDEALYKVKQVIEWFEEIGITRVFDKYCSTFDSTEKGNIGYILDYLLEYYKQQYTLVSPALPKNRREVFNGYLFADGVLLNEGSMRNHPLTPMTDSYIPRLLEKQSKYKCYSLNYQIIENWTYKKIIEFVKKLSHEEHFYIVPDYINDSNGKKLAEVFGNLKVLSGSSSLINEWYKHLFRKRSESPNREFSKDNSPVLLLSGSLSQQTKRQVNNFINGGGSAIRINKDSLKKENREKFYKIIDKLENDLLLYSSREENFDINNIYSISSEIESFFSDLAKHAIKIGIKKIIVAGGETSGAVISQLYFNTFIVEKNVAPGVPILRPIENADIQIVLKSGNFGKDDFFKTAIRLMEE